MDGALTGRRYPPQRHNPLWVEKIAVLVFAAWLQDQDYRVGLSVPPEQVDEPGSGVPWERALWDATRLQPAHLLRPSDRESLRDLIVADPGLRYDGIWHDHPGRIDVVGWGSTETLLVEAKGAVRSGTPKEAMSAIGRIALEMIPDRTDLAYGVLFPDDETTASGRLRTSGYVRTLKRETVQGSVLIGAGLRVYLIDAGGSIREVALSDLASRRLDAPSAAGPGMATS